MHATGNGHRSGEEWRSASEKSVLSRLPHNRGNWRSVGRPGLHPREDDKVVRAARRREQGRKRQAIPAGLTGSGGRTRRSQVRVPMHHGPGLSEDQCQREQQAEPRGIPVLGQGPGPSHPESIAWMTGRNRIHRRRTREPGVGSAVAASAGSSGCPRGPRLCHCHGLGGLLPVVRAAQEVERPRSAPRLCRA
jgi:hypothetical protein